MQICGIVSEYNPFHNGHLYQIEKTRQNGATHIVSVMSGNFVQRGDVAIFSKEARAKACVLNGVDLVVELPTPMSMAVARNFSFGAVSLLKQLDVNMISFGSECGDVKLLKEIANDIITCEKSAEFKTLLKKGKSHITAREEIISKNFSDKKAKIMSTPNNLLGIEYIIAMQKLKFDIDIFTVGRKGVEHDSDNIYKNLSSASNLRKLIIKNGVDAIKEYVPKSAFEIYKKEIELYKAPCDINKLNTALLYELLKQDGNSLKNIFDVNEGLENRILKAVKECSTFDEIAEFVSTKRYTKARIRRILLNILLSIDYNLAKTCISYARVLAMNEKGMEILKKANKSADIVISPKFANIYKMGLDLAFFEKKATDIFNLSAPKKESMKDEFQLEIFISKKAKSID